MIELIVLYIAVGVLWTMATRHFWSGATHEWPLAIATISINILFWWLAMLWLAIMGPPDR